MKPDAAMPQPSTRHEPIVTAEAVARSNPPARTELVPSSTTAVHRKPARHAATPWLIAGAMALAGTVAVIASRTPAHREEGAGIAAARLTTTAPSATNVTAPHEAGASERAGLTAESKPIGDALGSKTAAPQTLPAKKPNVDRAQAVVVDKTRPAAGGADARPLPNAAGPAPAPPRVSPAPAASTVAFVSRSPAPESTLESAGPMRTAPADSEAPPPATVEILGCLERDEDAFVLKNTSGADAPTSRSWKSGFLRKRRVSIELVDARGALKLQRYVGQRVTATGTLSDREMRPRTVQSLGTACD